MLEGFFQGRKRPHSPEFHRRILESSDRIIVAVDSECNKPVGFVTALTDEVRSGVIPFAEISPEQRNQRIGSTLVSRVLAKLEDIPAIDLTCDPGLQSFYVRFGMSRSVGMVIRNYKHIAGGSNGQDFCLTAQVATVR